MLAVKTTGEHADVASSNKRAEPSVDRTIQRIRAVVVCDRDGMTAVEIAAAMGITPRRVRQILKQTSRLMR